MLVRRLRRALKALVKNGWPAKAAAGSAISADSQWKKSRVSGVMSVRLPAHTDTDRSMMFIAAKPAMASERSRRFISASDVVSAVCAANGWAW